VLVFRVLAPFAFVAHFSSTFETIDRLN
jgi:hypothetical protein